MLLGPKKLHWQSKREERYFEDEEPNYFKSSLMQKLDEGKRMRQEQENIRKQSLESTMPPDHPFLLKQRRSEN